MADDPLRRLLRPPQPAAPKAEPASQRSDTGVAPTWAGPCLRLAGEVSSPSLVLRQREGRLTALSYSYLTSVRFDPAEGVEIEFVNHMVAIKGRRLTPVFDALALQRALELAESKSEFEQEEGTAFIETIGIVPTQPR